MCIHTHIYIYIERERERERLVFRSYALGVGPRIGGLRSVSALSPARLSGLLDGEREREKHKKRKCKHACTPTRDCFDVCPRETENERTQDVEKGEAKLAELRALTDEDPRGSEGGRSGGSGSCGGRLVSGRLSDNYFLMVLCYRNSFYISGKYPEHFRNKDQDEDEDKDQDQDQNKINIKTKTRARHKDIQAQG